jgi:hypothetical protein
MCKKILGLLRLKAGGSLKMIKPLVMMSFESKKYQSLKNVLTPGADHLKTPTH